MLGGGEGRRVILGGRSTFSPTTVVRVGNPFDRLKQRNKPKKRFARL
jgi:hypothetical protein